MISVKLQNELATVRKQTAPEIIFEKRISLISEAAVFQLCISSAFCPSNVSWKKENQPHKFISISSYTLETNQNFCPSSLDVTWGFITGSLLVS